MTPHTAQRAKMTAARKSAAAGVAITLLTTEVTQFIRSWKVASIREELQPTPKINSWELPDQTLKCTSRLQPDPRIFDKNVTFASALKSDLPTPVSKCSSLQSAYQETKTAQQHQSPEQPKINFEAITCLLQQSLKEVMLSLSLLNSYSTITSTPFRNKPYKHNIYKYTTKYCNQLNCPLASL